MIVKYYTCVLDDSGIDALRSIRSVVADSNHPNKATLIARLDGLLDPRVAFTAPQAYRTSWAANPGHEIQVESDEQIALRIVRTSPSGESPVSHRVLDSPIPAGIRHKILGYSITAVVASDDGARDQVEAFLKHERTLTGGGR